MQWIPGGQAQPALLAWTRTNRPRQEDPLDRHAGRVREQDRKDLRSARASIHVPPTKALGVTSLAHTKRPDDWLRS
jgi:hypothetical protein